MFFKKVFSVVIILPSVLMASCVSRPVVYNKGVLDKEKIKIAVLHFKDFNGSMGNNSGELISNIFEGKLLERGYKIIEIEKTASVVDYDFLVKNEYPSQWFIDTGSSIGADYMIYGSVHDYSVYQSYSTFIYIFGWLEITSSVGVTARMISCRTGEIVWSGSLTRKSYTFNDAADEVISDLVKTIKYKSSRR